MDICPKRKGTIKYKNDVEGDVSNCVYKKCS